ncbi:MAG: SDR family NAD(P)-dependent oxidoreductase [Candidatus Helarchaeota archaeon]
MKLKNKVAIITGAGAGIGKASAVLFAKEGAKVVCNSLSESAKLVVESLKNNGGEAIFVQGDISRDEIAKNIIQETIKHFGKIDILFNNAGIVIPGRVDNMSEKDWDRTMEVNVKGTFLVSKYAISELKKTKGVIINNASVLALKGVKERAAYTASKGAILSLTRAMAADYIGEIRVNCLCPGTTDTESLAKRIAAFSDLEKARADFISRQPMKRLGTPEEIAEAALFLATSEFCTGIYLSIDGGMTI